MIQDRLEIPTLDISVFLHHEVRWKSSSLFTESALRPIQSISCDVRLFVCLSVCLSVGHTLETTLPEGLETSGRRAYR